MRTSVIGIAVACVLFAGSAFASEEMTGQDVAGQHDCFGCHSIKADDSLPKKYGPYFQDIADKYKEKGEKAALLLENSILHGSHNKWDRPVDMQPRGEHGKNINQANAKKVAEWIMSLAGK